MIRDGAPTTDGVRIFATAMLIYVVFLAPTLEGSMPWNYVDGAVSLVESGRWEVLHPDLYKFIDTAPARGRTVSGLPPGMALLLAPLYAVWRIVAGPAVTRDDFVAFHALAVLVVSAGASALGAAGVARLAGWLGASRPARLWAAFLYAFGTHAFQFATLLHKENVAAAMIVWAVVFGVEPGRWRRRALAGVIAGGVVAVGQQTMFLPPLLAVVVARSSGSRGLAAFSAGALPPLAAQAAFNTWFFGAPWKTQYFAGVQPPPAMALPSARFLVEMLFSPHAGVVAHSLFLAASVIGFAAAWRRQRRGEVGLTVLLFASIWVMSAMLLGQFGKIPNGARYCFYGVPLLAAFAGLAYDGLGRWTRIALAAPSIALGYLIAQAGYMPGTAELSYAAKTFVSGTGMSVLFKETLPAWLGVETLHTMIVRPDVSAADVLRMLPTRDGLLLARNQLVMLLLNLAALALAGALVRMLWRAPSLDNAAVGAVR